MGVRGGEMSSFSKLLTSLLLTFAAILGTTFTADAAPPTGGDTKNTLQNLHDLWEKATYDEKMNFKAKALEQDPRKVTDDQLIKTKALEAERLGTKMNKPNNSAPASKAKGQAQATQGGNSAGDIAREQAVAAIDYSSRFLKNFTTEKGNKWNTFRDNIFVPMALLLLLPGAVLAQVKSIVSQGAPVIGQVSPFEGLQRSLIALFLIPGSYLIVNYAIDLANSIQYTIASEYKNMYGTDMYEDAMCAEIRAFSVRYLAENEGSLKTPPPDLSAIGHGLFSKAEGRLWGKLVDPCSGLNMVPANRDDASMPASTIAARGILNTTNAGVCTAWSILCAFQMAFFYYLFFLGPVMAALWVWPLKVFRDAFPNWCEGVITLCFWSLFWTTTTLLIACFKGTDDTGLFMITALNLLATASVKHAFDFAGLVKAAGQKAAELAEKMGKDGGKG